MSPAKYEDGKPPACPHKAMQWMDDKGAPYWLEDVTLSGGFKLLHKADVLAHSPDWLTLRGSAHTDGFGPEQVWTVAMAHLVCFRIVEG